MKLKYEISKIAINDLDTMWRYTASSWSEKQANKYFRQIVDAINIICVNPKMGKSIKEVKINHRSQVINSHLIIYKIEENKIFIDRILHQSMDIDNQLEK